MYYDERSYELTLQAIKNTKEDLKITYFAINNLRQKLSDCNSNGSARIGVYAEIRYMKNRKKKLDKKLSRHQRVLVDIQKYLDLNKQ